MSSGKLVIKWTKDIAIVKITKSKRPDLAADYFESTTSFD